MHWLRDRPCDVTGALHHTMITVPEEKKKFQNQAAKDWETILLARAKELAPGNYTFSDLCQRDFDIPRFSRFDMVSRGRKFAH